MTITDHAKERIIERTDFANSRIEAKRVAKIAWHSGLTIGKISALNPELADYMARKKEKNGAHTYIRFYRGNLYIWKGKGQHRLVTSYAVPKRFTLEVAA